MDEIKNTIKDLFSFDVTAEDVDKGDIVAKFQEIINSDDEEVKAFVKSWFDQSLQFATENGYVPEETEGEEEGTEEDNGEVKENDEAMETSDEEEDEEESKEESAPLAPVAPIASTLTMEQVTIKRANRFLI